MARSLPIGRVHDDLRDRGASAPLLDWVQADLTEVDLTSPTLSLGVPDDVAFADRDLLLRALCQAVVIGQVWFTRVDGFREAGRQLGVDEDWLEALVLDELGMSLERLWAFGVLELPVDATPKQVKSAHRRIAKQVHPDRLLGLDSDTLALHQARAADVNKARDVLAEPDEPGPDDDLSLEFAGHEDDDVALEPLPEAAPLDLAGQEPATPPNLGFDLEWLEEDAPTEIEGESAADATESLGDRRPVDP